jgi:serine/threonine-protein kinase
MGTSSLVASFWIVVIKQMAKLPAVLLLALASLILLAASACQSDDTLPTPTAVVLVRRLATVAPTATPDEAELQATQQALYSTPTLSPPTVTPTQTPYIGVFIGEAAPEDTDLGINPLDIHILPTRDFTGNIPLICTIDPATFVFGTAWSSDPNATDALRCPIQESYGFDGRVQIFEGGAMYQNPQTNEVWAIAPGTVLQNGRYWYEDQPPAMSTLGIEAPPGRFVPRDAFGAIWANNPQLRELLGYATTQEQNISVNLQRFEGGTLFLDATVGQVFVLLVNGEALGAYNAQ